MTWTNPRTWVANEVVSASIMNTHVRDNLKAIGDPWTSYTPAWTSSGSPTIGNGTLTGKYLQAGSLIIGRINLTIGSSTSVGSGVYSFSLPVACAHGQYVPVGTAHFNDNSSGNFYPGIAYRGGTTSTMTLVFGTARWGAAAPVAPAVDDVIGVLFTYEAL